MLAPFLEDSEWDKRRLALIHQHHLERVECFRLEHQSWEALESVYRAKLAITSPVDQAMLITGHLQTINRWLRDKEANRQLIKDRQEQEMADLNRQQES